MIFFFIYDVVIKKLCPTQIKIDTRSYTNETITQTIGLIKIHIYIHNTNMLYKALKS